VDTSSECQAAALDAINEGRAYEHLGPMTLPTNWSALTLTEQLFVATNLERTARGLPAMTGMSTTLDSAALRGALGDTDATPPSSGFSTIGVWTSNWAGGVGNPLEAVFLWMYDDGLNSPNVDCSYPGESGCWAHRDNILAPLTCSPCVMGSALASTSYEGEPSWAELLTGVIGNPTLAFSWSSATFASTSSQVVGMTASASKGYWLVSANGTVHSFGGAPDYGSAKLPFLVAVTGIAATPNGGGYWIVTGTGNVYAFGNAQYFGGATNIHLDDPIVGITSTPSGNGYWLVASDGGVFSYGEAAFHGSTGGMRLNKPVVGIASTSNGEGYWLVASDGGIFSFGNAQFHGSTGGMRLNKPVVGMTPSFDGEGYWLVASDGGIFSFGNAKFDGSTGNLRLAAPVVGMDSPGNGYWLVASDGGVFSFGVPFHGSMA
jgi:hypothetical protein